MIQKYNIIHYELQHLFLCTFALSLYLMSRTYFLSFLLTLATMTFAQYGHMSSQDASIQTLKQHFTIIDSVPLATYDVVPIYADTNAVNTTLQELFYPVKAIKVKTSQRLDMTDIAKQRLSIIDDGLVGVAAYSFSEKRHPSYEEGCKINTDILTRQLHKLFKKRQVDFVEIWAFYRNDNENVNSILWRDDLAAMFHDIKGYNIFDHLISLFNDDDDSYMIRLDYEDIKFRCIEREIHQKGHSGNVDIMDGHGRVATAGGQYWNGTKHCDFRVVDLNDSEHDFYSDKISASIGIMKGEQRYVIPHLGGLSYKEALARLTNIYYSGSRVYLPELRRELESLAPSYPDSCLWLYHAVKRIDMVAASSTASPHYAVLYPVSPGIVGNSDFQKIATQSAIRMGEELWITGRDFVFVSDEDIIDSDIKNNNIHHANLEISTCIVPYTDPIRWEVLCKLSDFAADGGHVIMLRHPQWTNLPANTRQQKLDSIKAAFVDRGCITSFRNYRKTISNMPRYIKSISYAGHFNCIHRVCDSSDIFLFTGVPRGSEISLHTKGWPELWDIETGATKPLHVRHRDDEWITIKAPLDANDNTLIVSSTTFANDTIELWKPDVYLKDDIAEIEFLHRVNGVEDFFMVRGIPQGAEVIFNAIGQPYLLDADTKKRTPIKVKSKDEERTSLIMPIENEQFCIIVFTTNN